MKTGLPLKKLGREFSYLLGEGRKGAGRLQIYHALLPQYSGKTFFRGRPRRWKKDTAAQLLLQAAQSAESRWDCREQIFSQDILYPDAGYPAIRYPDGGCADGSASGRMASGRGSAGTGMSGEVSGIAGAQARLPQELWAVGLYQCRPFDRLCVSLDEERGGYGLEQAQELLLPYLSRLRQVMYFGSESEVFLELEDYLYAEFGLVMTRLTRVPPELLWLDLREDPEEKMGRAAGEGEGGLKGENQLPDQQIIRGKNPCPGGVVNRPGMLKFLDTAVKNGYNTEVN